MRGVWRRVRPYVWIGCGGLAALFGLLMTLSAPRYFADRDAYLNDPPPYTTAVVDRTGVERRKADSYYVWLRLDDTGETVMVELPVPDDVFPQLTDGREVEVRMWDGNVARVQVPGGYGAETEDSPLTRSVEWPLAGTLGMVWGSFGVWHGLRQRRGEGPVGLSAVGRVLVALMAGTMAGFLVVVALDVYSFWAYGLTTLAVSLAMWFVLRKRA